jgi:hypothetical protein
MSVTMHDATRIVALIAVLPLCSLLASCGTTDPPLNDESDTARPAITAADYPAAIAAPASGYVTVDTPPSIDLRKSQTLVVDGWAFVPENVPCAGVGLVIDHKKAIPGTYGIQRPDVAWAYRQYTLWWVGYHIAEPAAALGPGTHTAYVVCKARTNAMYRNPTTYTVNVR